jgi:hypothetical protein
LAALLAAALPAGASTPGTAFTAGNLVVYRVGAGSAALTAVATAVSLDEYSTTGFNSSPVLSHALPTTASSTNPAVAASGTATSEGGLTVSTDGTTIFATGYNVTTGTAGVASTTSSATANQRVVAEVSVANGSTDSSTAFSSLFSGNNIRSAAGTTSGGALYAAGPTNGVVYATDGATTGTQLTPTGGDVNFRVVNIYYGQLYGSSASSTGIGIDTIGTGLETTAGSPAYTNLSGLDNGSSASPYGVLLCEEGTATSPNVAYVADSAANAVLKYDLVSGTWVADGSATTSGNANLTGVTGLTGTCPTAGGAATIYASSPTSLVSITDSAGTGALTASPTLLATAGTNEAFRGVALIPLGVGQSLPEVPFIIALPLSAFVLGAGALGLNRRRAALQPVRSN